MGVAQPESHPTQPVRSKLKYHSERLCQIHSHEINPQPALPEKYAHQLYAVLKLSRDRRHNKTETTPRKNMAKRKMQPSHYLRRLLVFFPAQIIFIDYLFINNQNSHVLILK